MIVGHLHGGIALQHRIKLHDVRVVPRELVRGAIATEHDVPGHRSDPSGRRESGVDRRGPLYVSFNPGPGLPDPRMLIDR
jgi:hypothetical protein